MTQQVLRIIVAVAVCLQFGCSRSPSPALRSMETQPPVDKPGTQAAAPTWAHCSTEMLAPLANADIQSRVGVNLTYGTGLGIAYTYDSRGGITGAAYLLADMCGPASHPSTKSFHIVYVPTGIKLNVHDAEQVEDGTVLDMDVSNLKEMTPIVRTVADVPALGYRITPADFNSALFIEISCGSVCDATKLRVVHRQFGASKVFLWLRRDALHVSPL